MSTVTDLVAAWFAAETAYDPESDEDYNGTNAEFMAVVRARPADIADVAEKMRMLIAYREVDADGAPSNVGSQENALVMSIARDLEILSRHNPLSGVKVEGSPDLNRLSEDVTNLHGIGRLLQDLAINVETETGDKNGGRSFYFLSQSIFSIGHSLDENLGLRIERGVS